MQAVAAGTGVDGCAVPQALALRVFNLFARTSAGVGPTLGHQALECFLVGQASLRLVKHACIWQQMASSQLLQDDFSRTIDAARAVHILDTNQPLTTVLTRIQPTGQRCDQRTGV